MKYVHFYAEGSFCESDSFKDKVGSDEYVAMTDEEYDNLIGGDERREKAEQLKNRIEMINNSRSN